MPVHETLQTRYRAARERLAPLGQDHVLRWWDDLDDQRREALLAHIDSVPWESTAPLIRSHVLSRPPASLPPTLSPADVYPHQPNGKRRDLYERAKAEGRRLLSAGKVTALTVAGGQGTRLGFDGPKGCIVVTPVGELSLFALFAGMVLAARRRYDAPIAWYIMTSPANHEETLAYFHAHHYFGLPQEDVRMFSQGMLPAFNHHGKALLAGKHALALAPDGHGGTLMALARSGSLSELRQRGAEIISYFQVDNPLVQPFDPLFLGLHAQTGSEMSTKVCPKADDLERVGNVCMADGRLVLIEYSDFPEELARQKNPDGSRMFDAGNLAIHALSAEFVERITSKSITLPYRRADKAVAFVDDAGHLQKTDKPNAVKLETFIFDALPLAANPLVLQVDRAEEFSPVKNATGPDSLETSRRDQNLRACGWLQEAGVHIPRKPDGTPDVVVTIAPSFALDREEVRARRADIPTLIAGQAILLD